MLEMNHLLVLARRGNHPGASGGEARAARLVAAVVADVPGLDDEAADQLRELISLLQESPGRVREYLDFVGVLEVK